jgi:thiamine pyrophosphokinase
MIAWILVSGRVVVTPEVERVRRARPPGLVVAADGGIVHAALLGVRPQLWVGDFDSSDPDDPRGAGIERRVFPRDKDELDAELALRAAAERGARDFVVWGAFGGRFDHTLALAGMAIDWCERGHDVLLHSGDESAVPVLGGRALALAVESGQTLSLLAFETLVDVAMTGVRWPLTRATVTPGTVRTMSNETTGARVELQAARGRGLVVLQHARGEGLRRAEAAD